MNIRQRDQQFLAFTQSLLKPTQAQVGAVAEAIGCPDWVGGCCDGVDHPRTPHECHCAKGAADVLKLAGEGK